MKVVSEHQPRRRASVWSNLSSPSQRCHTHRQKDSMKETLAHLISTKRSQVSSGDRSSAKILTRFQETFSAKLKKTIFK